MAILDARVLKLNLTYQFKITDFQLLSTLEDRFSRYNTSALNLFILCIVLICKMSVGLSQKQNETGRVNEQIQHVDEEMKG